jgi:hypothetical protein
MHCGKERNLNMQVLNRLPDNALNSIGHKMATILKSAGPVTTTIENQN